MKKYAFFALLLLAKSFADCLTPYIPPCLPELNFLNPARCSTVEMTADFLYLKANSETFDWAATYLAYTPAFPPALSLRQNLRIRDTDFPWTPSFRVSGAFSISGWDNTFAWTYFNGKNTDSASFQINPENGVVGISTRVVVPAWVSGNGVIDFGLFSTRYRMVLNCFDWELGKSLYATKKLLMRPFFGMRGTRMTQKMITKGTNQLPLVPNEIQFSKMKVENDFRGLGPRIGCDGKWKLGSVFSFYGNAAASLLGGYFDLHEDETFSYVSPTDVVYSKNTFKFWSFKPSIDVGLGIELFYEFIEERFTAKLDIGYEFHAWPEQMQLFRLYNAPYAIKQVGDVGIQGLAVSGAICF